MININQKTLYSTTEKSIVVGRNHFEIFQSNKTVQIISDFNQIKLKTQNNLNLKTTYISFDQLYNHLSNI